MASDVAASLPAAAVVDFDLVVGNEFIDSAGVPGELQRGLAQTRGEIAAKPTRLGRTSPLNATAWRARVLERTASRPSASGARVASIPGGGVTRVQRRDRGALTERIDDHIDEPTLLALSNAFRSAWTSSAPPKLSP